MTYTIVGLGNPGEEYKNTRHNVGRIILEVFRKANDLPDFETDKKLKAMVSAGQMSNVKRRVSLVFPETFMNKSGDSVKQLIKSKKAAGELVVVHDDLDIPLGKYKISFNKSSGGHEGVESIIRAVKTQAFTRIRIGISPITSGGKLKKPKGEEDVERVIDACMSLQWQRHPDPFFEEPEEAGSRFERDVRRWKSRSRWATKVLNWRGMFKVS